MKAAAGKVKTMLYVVKRFVVQFEPTKVLAASIMAGGFYLGMGNMPAAQVNTTINNHPPTVTVKERPIVVERMKVNEKREIKTVPKK